jgi:hypothetical protein
MKVFSTIFEKIIWFVIFLFLFIGGGIFVLRVFLAPPPVQTPSSPNQSRPQVTPTTAANPTATSNTPTPTTNTSSSQIDSTPAPSPTAPTPTPTVTPSIEARVSITPTADSSPAPNSSLSNEPNSNSETSSTSSDDESTENANPQIQPALALPNQVAMNVPRRLRRGAVLSIYENVDNNIQPDPINYSPSVRKNVAGLTLINLNQSQFQEVSGYFLVEKTGDYSFVISFPDTYVSLNSLRLRIDGQPLDNLKGGNISLERGWHKIDLFYMEGYNSVANQIQVKWGRVGSNLKRLQTWREP